MKEHVHLAHEETVFLTGWERVKDGEFSLTARWPPPPEGLPYDPRVLTQTIRQSGLVVAHAAYDVPLTCQTLLHHFDFAVTPGFRAAPADSSPLGIGITVTDPKMRGRNVSSLSMEVRVLQGDDVVARADSEFGWVSPAAYRRLRGEHLTVRWNEWPLPRPVAPCTVGRADDSEVLLAPGTGSHRWQLRNDVGNHLLYDHPVDHVPGLVLMEAAAQAANAVLHPRPFEATTVTSTFDQYAEFDRPCWIDAEVIPSAVPGETTVLISASQSGRSVFRGRLSGPCG